MSHRPPELARAHGAALVGVEAISVEVQAASTAGLPRGLVLGRAETEVRESRERIKVALTASGLWWDDNEPNIVINLAPAGLKKAGTGLDLPIALALAVLRRKLPQSALADLVSFGEIGLDGRLRAPRGALSVAIGARARGHKRLLIPPEAARQAAEVDGLEVLAVRTVADAVRAARGDLAACAPWPTSPVAQVEEEADLGEVRGQLAARRALEVAAAGAHNLLFLGPPGSGKTMLARRLPTILPPLTRAEALEVTQVHSAAGLVPAGCGLMQQRPFRAPHHSISVGGLVGGGTLTLQPGELSLATHGVLFLDELPEFPRAVLEALRQPLESGFVQVARTHGAALFPARVTLAAAMNPCPCGWRGSGMRRCCCTPPLVERYMARVSGPLIDRIDLHLEVPPVSAAELAQQEAGEGSAAVRGRVEAARARQLARHRPGRPLWNAHLRPRDLRSICALSARARQALDGAMERLRLSARAHDRVLKVARTIADLAGRETIDVVDVAEAVGYRVLDRPSDQV